MLRRAFSKTINMAGSVTKTISLEGTGDEMPVVAYGTFTIWQAKPGEVTNGVKTAIDAGYRHIDCAWVYDNEDEVGQALAEKIADDTIKREDVFVTTKIWNNFHTRERVKLNLKKSLEKLQLTYVDLALVHWPNSFKAGDDNFPKDADGKVIFGNYDLVNEVWRGMEDCVESGLARNIGISNFNSKQIQRILDGAKIKPCNIQFESNPTFSNQRLVDFCKSKGITVSCYASIGAPGRTWKEGTDPCAIEDPVITTIASNKGKSPAQVILRWHLQRGVAVCVKSVNPDRIRQNIDIFDFELSAEEMSQISGLDKNFRLYVEPIAKGHPEYPFDAEF